MVVPMDLCNGVEVVTPSRCRVVLFPLEHPPLGGVYACFFNQLGQCPGVEVLPVSYSRDDTDGWLARLTIRYASVAGGVAAHVFFSDGQSKTKRDARNLVMATASPVLRSMCDGVRFPPLSYRKKRVGFVDVSGKVMLT